MPSVAKLPPVHPGEILLEEFLNEMGISQYRLAKDIGVSPRRINEIVHRKRAITADTALRLAKYFGTTARFWMNLQSRYDLEVAEDRLGAKLDRVRTVATMLALTAESSLAVARILLGSLPPVEGVARWTADGRSEPLVSPRDACEQPG